MPASKTKYQTTEQEVIRFFNAHGIMDVTSVTELGAGEFNAAFRVSTPDKEYVLKIAPPEEARVLSYEQHMMQSEVFWYEQMKAHTKIHCPAVIVKDYSREIIHSECFIMDFIPGIPLWEVKEEEKEKVYEGKIGMLTEIHRIHGTKFGYRQMGLYENWYEAILHMAGNLVLDCESLGQKTPDGHKFLDLIHRHKEILMKAPCRMVNFDLWDPNVLYTDGELYWIDPERGFWGDPIADFITLGAGQMTPLSEKTHEIEVYNRTAEEPVTANREECIRYAFAVCYLALIEEVEKFVRYEPGTEVFIRNTQDSRRMFDMAFEILEK